MQGQLTNAEMREEIAETVGFDSDGGTFNKDGLIALVEYLDIDSTYDVREFSNQMLRQAIALSVEEMNDGGTFESDELVAIHKRIVG